MSFAAIVQNAKIFVNNIGRTTLVLIFLWLSTVWWGEHGVFQSTVGRCQWQQWETWNAAAKPHHVLLIADPQLVDPHTYPGRPWVLNKLTVLYTDLYLRRSYQSLLRQTLPDSTLFLGDLFDGGREWGHGDYHSPDKELREYGMDFWLNEYHRFMELFVGAWVDAGLADVPSINGHRFIASLPGNHDLGFASGIDEKVKSRFEAHFGAVNRLDLLGNHTFVSLDTVSLSAMDEIDRQTGMSGAGDGTAPSTKKDKIWKPVEQFLKDAENTRERAVKQEVRRLDALSSAPQLPPRHSKFDQTIYSPDETSATSQHLAKDPLQVATSQLPTVVLTHVPLYRSDSANCGPHRERGTSIPLQAGYQYQNVLTPTISKDIIDHLDANQVIQVYSGDDHDYCEVEHGEFSGRIKEITVKSMSWAMGIRRPAVQLVSLWNPLDIDTIVLKSHAGEEIDVPSTPKNTLQNHMCYLPDQLGVFIRYGQLLLFTLIVLFVRALRYKAPTTTPISSYDVEKSDPLLPSYHKSAPKSPPPTSVSSTFASASATSRKGAAVNQSYDIPLITHARNNSAEQHYDDDHTLDTDDYGLPSASHITTRKVANLALARDLRNRQYTQYYYNFLRLLWIYPAPSTRKAALVRSFLHVAVVAVSWYMWLMWMSL